MIRDAWTVMRKDLQELRSCQVKRHYQHSAHSDHLRRHRSWRFDVGWDAPLPARCVVWLPWLPPPSSLRYVRR